MQNLTVTFRNLIEYTLDQGKSPRKDAALREQLAQDLREIDESIAEENARFAKMDPIQTGTAAQIPPPPAGQPADTGASYEAASQSDPGPVPAPPSSESAAQQSPGAGES